MTWKTRKYLAISNTFNSPNLPIIPQTKNPTDMGVFEPEAFHFSL